MTVTEEFDIHSIFSDGTRTTKHNELNDVCITQSNLPHVAEHDHDTDRQVCLQDNLAPGNAEKGSLPTSEGCLVTDAPSAFGKTESHDLRHVIGCDDDPRRRSVSSILSASIRSVGSHSVYADTSPRTLLRGWLHGIICVLLFPIALALLIALLLQDLPVRWITAVILLVGKFASYFASSILHLFPFQTKAAESIAHRVDMAFISISIGVSPCPFTLQLDELLVTLGIHTLFFAVRVGAIIRHARGVQLSLVLPQFIFAITSIGMHIGFTSPLWLTGVLSYALGFVAFGMALQAESKCVAPWHRLVWYGWHDDFHVLLFGGDLIAAIAGAMLLENPDLDQKPHWWFDR